MKEPIYFGNIIYQARTQHCMSILDFQLVMKNTHGIDLSDFDVYQLEGNRGHYCWLIPVLAQVYNCDENWLYTLYEQTPRN